MPLPLDPNASEPVMSGLDANYSAAMAAADAVFGTKPVQEAALQEPPIAHARRILPCLLQAEAHLAPVAEMAEKARVYY